MLNTLLAGITSFLVSFTFLPFIIKFSKKKNLGALPGRRRIHKKITPSLGGVAIFFGFTLGCVVWAIKPGVSIIFLLLPILIIPFIIGLLDDLVQLRPLAKLIAQVATASLIFSVLDIQLSGTYGLFGEIHFPEGISYVVTLLAIVLITNSLNLIDGIDGLAAAFSFIACLFFGSWFFLGSNYPYAILCFALAGGILAFLFQNWEPSNIFMGDTGSLVIGTILSVIMMQFINQNYSLSDDHSLKFNSSIGTALAVLIIPLTDTTRIIIIRLSRGISPFTPDKRHIHHALVRIGCSHKRAVYILTLVHISIIGLAIALKDSAQWILLLSIVSIATMLCVWLDKLISNTVQKETA